MGTDSAKERKKREITPCVSMCRLPEEFKKASFFLISSAPACRGVLTNALSVSLLLFAWQSKVVKTAFSSWPGLCVFPQVCVPSLPHTQSPPLHPKPHRHERRRREHGLPLAPQKARTDNPTPASNDSAFLPTAFLTQGQAGKLGGCRAAEVKAHHKACSSADGLDHCRLGN